MIVSTAATNPVSAFFTSRTRSTFVRAAATLAAVLMPFAAQALSVSSFTPQGEVAAIRQVVVKFSEPASTFGDLRLPDPYEVRCEGANVSGEGRWADDRTWLYDFKEALPPGVRCTANARSAWKPLSGTLQGRTEFKFQTGGPAVASVDPYGGTIDEDQHFLLRLTGPALESSVRANAWCEVQGIGEKLPVRIVTGPVRDRILKQRRLESQAARLLLVACDRPLPADVDVRLVWGKGIAAAGNPAIATTSAQQFRFHVREAFKADFSCERERADAGCMPLRPIGVQLSAPVPRKQAEAARLQPVNGTPISPYFDADNHEVEVDRIEFKAPLPEDTAFTLTLPADLKDNANRPLSNAGSFPLKVRTGPMPPIAKFSAAPFGVVELNADAMLPLTLRRVQGDLRPRAPSGSVRVKRLLSDADILDWFVRVEKNHERSMTAREAGFPPGEWLVDEERTDQNGRTRMVKVDRIVGTRELSLLKKESDAARLDLPQLEGGDPRPFEVIGIPLPEPGYHVVEIESGSLGEALLDRKAPMYVRTGVLVTNLGVHFKHGRENSLAWVTTLDRAKPVADAEVNVNDCSGRRLWSGRTDAQGLARIPRVLERNPPGCNDVQGYFVTARKADAKGRVDTTFVFSSWQKGIESWRFNVPTDTSPEPDTRAHTVFDRTLFRAGETVSMKHFLRLESSSGLAGMPANALPTQVKLTHQGTEQSFTQPLDWSGTRSATSQWKIPAGAKLGVYDVTLERLAAPDAAGPSGSDTADDRRREARSFGAGSFRVEEFRLPLVDARLNGPKGDVIAPASLPLSVQLSYLAGGGMSGTSATVSALLKPRDLSFPEYEEFSFVPPRNRKDGAEPDADEADDGGEGKLVADKVAITTDRAGAASLNLQSLPPVTRASELTAELNFADPNGEVQTAATRIPVWPSAVVLGLKASSWAGTKGDFSFQVLALDTAGKPLKGQRVDVRGRLAQTISTRKRMVGGFYAYDNRTELKELGALCQGTTDDRGLLLCKARLEAAGEVELIAAAKDANGRASEAATSVWITKQGELWFTQDNDDRIDLLPEKKRYEPGETARLQVRMPFREATALVSVEREGIIDTRVVNLRGDDPTIEVPIAGSWAPNVYVTALVLRGRIRDVPWYSFFTWGWKEPLSWVRSFWFEGREYQAPTAMIDLAKPAFKYGVAALRVGTAEHHLDVSVAADKPQYGIRETAKARIKVSQNGKPLAGAEVAFAAVDEGLLALRDNDSWNLLDAMLKERSLGVEVATAQSEIIGRRHYGRKAIPAGGGGGKNATRELFDTLLVWKPRVVLDANGEATVDVPLNDSLTSFRFVAVADAGASKFGTGSATVKVTQDLQALSGLPPLVRAGDRFTAMLTLRNTTTREMAVQARLQGESRRSVEGAANAASAPAVPIAQQPAPQDVVIPAGGATEVRWSVDVPENASSLSWEASAESKDGKAKDRVKVSQIVKPAVPIRVLQATLAQLDGPYELTVAAPVDGLPESAGSSIRQGGINVAVQPKLTGALPGIRRFFETYPYICLEQKTSKSVGLKDADMWAQVAASLPSYLDSDGLASYFPPGEAAEPAGSDRLTAYVLAATNEANFALPDAPRDAMLDGLTRFVEGRLTRQQWERPNLKVSGLDVRKLSAIEALSRYGRAQPRMLGSIQVLPNLWPTSAVIDWYSILRRVEGIPERAKRLEEAQQILRSRLTYAGTTLRFSTEESDFWWWLMESADANAARLVLAVMDDPAWKEDLPRMVVGSLARQKGGAWLTTTANLWGSLALDKFSAKFESEPVAGRTIAAIGTQAPNAVDWAAQPAGGSMLLAWPEKAGSLGVRQEGSGKPWLTVQSLAAVPLKAPINAGYRLTRTVTAVERKQPGSWSRGDVVRVRVQIDAQSDMTWVAISDPVPAGATLLGSGLGRDSAIATRSEGRSPGNSGGMQPVFVERSFEAFRGYYDYLPSGQHVIEYTMRLNNPGRFALPPTRVEALYAPESFGELPNAAMEVAP